MQLIVAYTDTMLAEIDHIREYVSLWGPLILAATAGLALANLFRSSPRRWRRFRCAPFSPIAPFDHADQLRAVERASFRTQRLMNRGEARLMQLVASVCEQEAPGWRVMAQVSLGEILASDDPQAYRAINSKRVDLLLIDADSRPLHAIELQGSGHYIGSAVLRDAIKRAALRKAGVGCIEITAGMTPVQVRRELSAVIQRSGRFVTDGSSSHVARPA